MKKHLLPSLILILILASIIAGVWLLTKDSPYTKQEFIFLKQEGFLNEQGLLNKSSNLIEQNLNSPDESFEVLATKLDESTYQLAFKLENKSNEKKEFYLIPISKQGQVEFKELSSLNKIQQEEVDKPLAELYDVEEHKQELKPELAQAYNDIDNNNYQAKPIKLTLDANSFLLAKSKWEIARDPDSGNLKPVYLLVYGSAGGAKDEIANLGNYIEAETTLANKDTSGTFQPAVNETEIISERTRSFKKFRLPDTPDNRARYRIGGQIGPVHYKLDPFNEKEIYKEIDLTVHLTPDEPWDAAMETNGYQVRFWQSRIIGGRTVRYIAQYRRAGKWLAMAPMVLIWENDLGEKQLISKPLAVGAPNIDNENYRVTWSNVFGQGIDFRYNLSPDEFFKTVIVNNKSDLPLPTINTQGLKLTVVMAISWHNGSKAANNFANSITTADLSDSSINLNNPDEELVNPENFSFKDELNRDTWWLRQPKAWDSAKEKHFINLEHTLLRKGNYVFALLSIPYTTLNNPEITYPLYIDTAIDEEQVASDADDGYDYGGTLYGTDGTDIGQLFLNYSDTTSLLNLMRFTTVPIPNGATIDSAAITVHVLVTDDPACTIYCEDIGDSPNLVTVADIDGRTLTTASKAWSDTDIGVDDWKESPDIKDAVEEVVALAGWSSNNALSVITVDTQSTYAFQCHSYFFAGGTLAPKFNCSYTAAAPAVPSVEIKGSTIKIKGGTLRIK